MAIPSANLPRIAATLAAEKSHDLVRALLDHMSIAEVLAFTKVRASRMKITTALLPIPPRTDCVVTVPLSLPFISTTFQRTAVYPSWPTVVPSSSMARVRFASGRRSLRG